MTLFVLLLLFVKEVVGKIYLEVLRCNKRSSKLFSLNGYNLYTADSILEEGAIAVWSTGECAEVFVECPNSLKSEILILKIKQ